MSPHSASRFFYLHVRWAHTAQHFFSFFVRKSHITRVHTAHHDFFLTSCQMSPSLPRSRFFLGGGRGERCVTSKKGLPGRLDEPTQRNIFFSFLCVNLISRESTQRITIFLTSCQMSTVARKDKTLPRIQKHIQESKKNSQNPKHVPESGFWKVVLNSGTCFGFRELFLDSGKCFGFWGVFLDSGTCFRAF